MARSFSKYAYTSDDGNVYSVRLADDIGGEAVLGFTAATNQPGLPNTHEMRYVILHDPVSGAQVKRPVATLAVALWTAPQAAAIGIDQFASGTPRNMMVSSLHGEKRLLGVVPVPGP